MEKGSLHCDNKEAHTNDPTQRDKNVIWRETDSRA